MKHQPKFCKKCGKILRKENRSGYCHRDYYRTPEYKFKDRQRNIRWRKANPDKVKAIQERYRRKKNLLLQN